MGVDQLLVDPVTAAFRQFVDIQLARGEHHLAGGAVDFIAIDVNVGKVIVGSDFLNLTERVLQRTPVPQPDVLERRLIVGGVGSLDGCLRGKLALGEAVQPEGLPRQINVVGNVGLLANQLIGFDDKAGNIPADCLKRKVTDHGGKNRQHQPAPAGQHRQGVDARQHRAQQQRRAHHEHAGKQDVRVHVGYAAEDGVILKQLLEAADVEAHRGEQHQERKRDGEPAPGQRDVAVTAGGEHPRTAGNKDKKNGEQAGNHGQRQQPANDELPGGQCEQIEVQGPAKNRIHHAARGAWRVPVESERGPFRHHPGAGHGGDEQRGAGPDQAQNGFDRQVHWLSADENGVTARQIGEARPLQGQERSIQDEEGGRGKRREYGPTQAQGPAKHVAIAEGPEPECVNIIRQRRPSASHDDD